MIEGVDYLSTGPTPAQLVAAGKHFTLGYIDRPDSGLTAAAIAARHAAGLDVGLIAEWGKMRLSAGAPAGATDGARAKAALDALGAPAGTVVYFAADWDVQPAQYVSVDAYLANAKAPLAPYRVGLYGGYDIVSHVKAVTFLWQTYAWSGGQWAPGVELQQYSNGQSIGGATVDLDRALVAEWGQWKAGDMAIYTVGGVRTGVVAAGTPYYANPGDTTPRAKIATTATYLLTAFDATGKWTALDGNYAKAPGALAQCGWVPLTSVTGIAPYPVPILKQTVTVTGQGITISGPK